MLLPTRALSRCKYPYRMMQILMTNGTDFFAGGLHGDLALNVPWLLFLS